MEIKNGRLRITEGERDVIESSITALWSFPEVYLEAWLPKESLNESFSGNAVECKEAVRLYLDGKYDLVG